MAARRNRSSLQPVDNRRYDRLSQISPSAFEQLIADHYRTRGFSIERVGHAGARFDGGIDLKLRRGGEFIVVQCKRENAYKVTHNVGHELLGVMCTQGATSAIVVNTGEFTPYARESARGDARLTLVDGDELRRWFPELAVPAGATGEPVPAEGLSRHRRGGRRVAESKGLGAFAGTAAVLATLLVWQCSRPAPSRIDTSVRPSAAMAERQPPQSVREARPQVVNEAASPTAELMPVDRPDAGVIEFRPSRAAERAEWDRRNAEAMRVIEATTPEF